MNEGNIKGRCITFIVLLVLSIFFIAGPGTLQVSMAATADRDSDGLTDYEEGVLGTNDNVWDSDGDGINDLDDAFPTDATQWKDSDGEVFQISPVGSSASQPWIWGPYVVWADLRPGGQHDLYLYDLRTGSGDWVTDDPGFEERPRISGKRIVWEEWVSGASFEIFSWDLDFPGKIRWTNDSIVQEFPNISGNRIVYSGPYWTDPVWMQEYGIVVETTINSEGVWPMIDGDWVVWAQQVGGQTHLFVKNVLPTGTPLQITSSDVGIAYFEISGQNIVYDSGGGGG